MIIKAKFLRDGEPYGKEYTYLSDIDVSVGDTVMLTDTAQGIVTAVDVPEEEVAAFRDRLKKIVGVVDYFNKKITKGELISRLCTHSDESELSFSYDELQKKLWLLLYENGEYSTIMTVVFEL